MEKEMKPANELWYLITRKAVLIMRKTLKIMLAALMALGLFGFGSRSFADSPEDVTVPVPWVSDISGKADSLMIKQSDTDWFQATENTPLGEGDMVWQDKGGQSEIYIGQGTYLRLAEDSGVQFTKLANDEVRVTLTKGTVVAASGGAPLMLDVPGQSVVLNAGDRARVDVADNGATRVTASGGRVEVDGPRGRFNLGPGQSLSADSNGEGVQLVRTAQGDRFDQWNNQRDQQLAAAAPPPVAADYLPAPAAAEMAANGVWINDPTYGYVWRPRVVVGWTPYRDGRWVWRPAWGWTWVSYEPWGWYPYHYGRWVLVSGGWVWAPVHIVRTHWSPALVFWVDGPDYIAWQPIPYNVISIGVFINLGPSHYDRYIDHRCMTVVRYNDFGRGHYDHYVRPWPGSCGSSCHVVRDPYPEVSRHVNVRYDVRTPRSNGYVPRAHVPTDTRLYAHTPAVPGGRVKQTVRVDYGSRNLAPRGNNLNHQQPPVNTRQPANNNGHQNPAVNNGNKGNGNTQPWPKTTYQDRNNPAVNSNHGPSTQTRLPMNYGRDERGNMVQVPAAPNGNGARSGNGNTASTPRNPAVNNRGTNTPKPNTQYGYNPNNGAHNNVNTAKPNTGYTAPKPAPQTRTYSAPPANNNAGRNTAVPRSYNSAPRTSAPAPKVSPPRASAPAPSHAASPSRGSSSSHAATSRPASSHASAPARSSSSHSSGGRSDNKRK